jgi:hypothetical protein
MGGVPTQRLFIDHKKVGSADLHQVSQDFLQNAGDGLLQNILRSSA